MNYEVCLVCACHKCKDHVCHDATCGECTFGDYVSAVCPLEESKSKRR